MSNNDFKKLYRLTPRHCTYPTRLPINQSFWGPYNITSQGSSYALTAVCDLTGYFMTTPIKDKKTMTVANHLFSDIMLKFDFPRILHSDIGTEFKF